MSKQELRNKMLSIVESAKRELRELTDDEKKELEECKREMEDDTSKDDDDKKKEEEENADTSTDETPKDDEETQMEEEAKEDEEPSDDETPNEDEKDEEPSTYDEEPSDKEKRNKNLKGNNIIMEKKFSLVKAIRNIAENRNLDDSTMAVINAGREEMRKSGLSYAGQIQLPSEKRAIVSVTAEGEDTVATDVLNIIDPLRSNLVLAQAGAKILDNLVGDVKIPVLGASNVGWEGENAEAKDGSGAITSVTLKPKRLSCFIDISKQMILQSESAGVEDAIRRDIVEAIAHKFQATILGDGAGDATQPSGLFNGLVDKTATDFDSMAAIEADLETANVSNISYIASPKARAAMRAMTKGAKNNAVVAYANGEFDGTPVYSTSDVANSKFLVGDFSNLYLGQWGAIDLVVDNYTQATKGAIRLVVNVYLDAVNARPNSIVSGKFGA